MKAHNFLLLVFICFLTICWANWVNAEWSPLPADMKIETPSPEVPPNIAVFSGLFAGTLQNINVECVRHIQIVVEKINLSSQPTAVVVYSLGRANSGQIGSFLRLTGRIIEGPSIIFQDDRYGYTVRLTMTSEKTMRVDRYGSTIVGRTPATGILFREK